MALRPNILEVTLMWSAPAYSITTSDNFRKTNAKFQKVFQVVTKPESTEADLFFDERLPSPGDSFSSDFPFIYAEGTSLTQVGPIFWMATVDYSGELALKEDETYDNPLFAPPRIDWDDVETEEETDEDFDGRPIQTKNGEAITGVAALIPDQTVTIKRNLLLFNPYVQARYRRSVNSDLFLGWPPGTAKLVKLSASNVVTKELAYWEVTGQVRFRFPYRTTPEKAWYKRVMHKGYNERIELSGPGAGTAIVRAVDDNKEPVTKEVLLDARGFRIPEAAEGEEQIAHWLEFKLYDSLPYNALGLI
jgi:hypothetical protein